MWLNDNPVAELRTSFESLLIEYEIDALWLIGSRARGDATPQSDWDFMVLFRKWNVKIHAEFESNLRELCGGKSSALTLLHVISVLPPEHGASVIRDAIALWKVC